MGTIHHCGAKCARHHLDLIVLLLTGEYKQDPSLLARSTCDFQPSKFPRNCPLLETLGDDMSQFIMILFPVELFFFPMLRGPCLRNDTVC